MLKFVNISAIINVNNKNEDILNRSYQNDHQFRIKKDPL
jgi:hypothetical protein